MVGFNTLGGGEIVMYTTIEVATFLFMFSLSDTHDEKRIDPPFYHHRDISNKTSITIRK